MQDKDRKGHQCYPSCSVTQIVLHTTYLKELVYLSSNDDAKEKMSKSSYLGGLFPNGWLVLCGPAGTLAHIEDPKNGHLPL